MEEEVVMVMVSTPVTATTVAPPHNFLNMLQLMQDDGQDWTLRVKNSFLGYSLLPPCPARDIIDRPLLLLLSPLVNLVMTMKVVMTV